MRWRWPPENSCGYFSPSSAARPTCLSSSATRAAISASSSREAEHAHRLGDDVAHAPARVQAGIRDPGRSSACGGACAPVAARAAGCEISTPSNSMRPRDGAYRPTISRATVDLPQPDSPTSASVSPLPDLERHAVHRAQQLARLALDDAVQPRPRDVEVPARRRCKLAAVPLLSHRASRRRGWRRPRSSSGRSTRQRSKRFGQRGLKAQPGGMAFRRGIAPSICTRRRVRACRRRRRSSGSSPSGPTV